MIGWLACRRHRGTLTGFVDRGEWTESTPAALAHLAACERCEAELTDLALTIAALRRLGRDLRASAVPATPVPVTVAAAPPARTRRSFLPRPSAAASPLASVLVLVVVLAPMVARGTPASVPAPSAPVVAPATPTRPADATAARVSVTVPDRRYDPPAGPLTRDVVATFIKGNPLSVPGPARSVPFASDRVGSDAVIAIAVAPASDPSDASAGTIR